MTPRRLPPTGVALFLVLSLMALGTGRAQGAVAYPMLEVVSLGGGDGIEHTAGGQLVLTLTAPYILSAPGVVLSDLTPDAPLSLVAGFTGAAGNNYHFAIVSLVVGEPGTPLLQANAGTLTLTSLGFGFGTFSGSGISLTGGSLAPPLPATEDLAGSFSGASANDFSQSFTAATVQGKLGAVVPEPLSLGLVGGAILGLLAVRRRQRA